MTAKRRRIPAFLRAGARLIRLRDLWDKLLHIGACAILLWASGGRTGTPAAGLILYLAGVSALLIGGYTANDTADFHKDRLGGADTRGPGRRRGQSLAVAITALTLGTILLMVAVSGVLSKALTAGSVLLGVEYSLPPLRFKERGIWGVIVGAFTQRPALFLIWAASLGVWDRLTAFMAVWLFAVGMAGMLGHQVLDRWRDRAGQVRTFVFLKGPRPALRLGAACAAAAGAAAVAPLVLMPFDRAWPVAAALLLMSAVSAGKALKASRKIGRLDPD
jgi:4-hydroxybenzoate polyprenyltransferase